MNGDQTTPTDVQDLPRLLGEALGEASMCWSPRPEGVFDASKAKEILERLQRELAGEVIDEFTPHLLRDAAQEIRRLRQTNEVYHARVDTLELVRDLLYSAPRGGGPCAMGEDIAWKLEQRATLLEGMAAGKAAR